MLAAVARRSVPILVVALALFVPAGASAFPGLSPLLRAVRPTPLAGKVVGIDPGHNGGNFSDPSFINSPVWNGREEEACDTTGTETDGGYTEALFNFRVASYLRRDLIAEGAKVVMTRRSNTPAEGGPAAGGGVATLPPAADGPNDHVIASSRRFGRILLHRYTKLTGVPISNYDGSGGFAPRDNLAGLNLTTVPKVLIECVNMRNAAEATRLVKPGFQKLAARSMADAITVFLQARG